MGYVLETNLLTKKFGNKTALKDVNIHVSQGDIYGFIGKNGAGKTTLMRIALGLANPTSGEIKLFGEPANDNQRKMIGSLIETPSLFKNYSATENLRLFSILYNADPAAIPNVLRMVGLVDTGNLPVRAFSLGMKQRLGIAIALLGNPQFLILDEPVNGLDPAGIKDIRDLILTLNSKYGITFLISSHLLDELSKMVTKYGIINNGVLIEEVDANELKERCTHRLVITTNNMEKSINLIKDALPDVYYEINNNKLILRNHIAEVGGINKMLVENGILVTGLETRSDGLEDYFVQRIGR